MRALVVGIGLVVACGPELRPAGTEPDLDRLAAVELGGGGSVRAWNVVFVGDGYGDDDQARYRAIVDELVAGLTGHAGGFVAIAPEAFRFHRVDAVGPGWQLGTRLDASESCGQPFIVADRELVARAAQNAVAAPDVIVVLAHDLDGRADGAVHMSDREPWPVLEHELSHALFGLADEYSEMTWCSERAPDEATLLATANVTALADDAKWAGLVSGAHTGGARWPCLHHPTGACRMLDAHGPAAYCPVCAAAVRETIAARLCGPDQQPPRVALVDPVPWRFVLSRSGMTYTLEAAAYDDGDVVGIRFVVDGVAIGAPGLPWAELALDALAPGPHVLEAEAIDAAGHVGRSAPHGFEIVHAAPLAADVVELAASAGDDGWIRATVVATPVGGTVAVTVAGGPPVIRSIATAEPLELWIPAAAIGPATVSATARTAGGVASAPVAIVVDIGAPAAPPPVIDAVTVAGIELAAFAATGPALELEVRITGCAALDRIDVATAAGDPLGAVDVDAAHDCAHVVRLALAPVPGAATITARDRFGRTGTRAITLPPITDMIACGIAPHVDDPVVGLARPAELALAAPGTTVAGTAVSAGGVLAPAFAVTRADGSRGVLVAATDVPGPLRDGEPVALAVTVVGVCAGELVATTATVAVTVDAVAPVLRVHRFTHAGAPLRVDAIDGGGDVLVDTTTDGDLTVVRAIDAAGNVSQRSIAPVEFPHHRAGCPP